MKLTTGADVVYAAEGENIIHAQEKPYALRKLQARDIPVFAKIIGKIGIDELIACYGDDDFTELLVKLKNRKEILGETDSNIFGEGQQDGTEPDFSGETKDDGWVMGVAVAARIANKILMGLDRCSGDVFSLLGSLSGLTSEEVSELDLDIFMQMLVDVITGNNIVNFIKAAIKFLK